MPNIKIFYARLNRLNLQKWISMQIVMMKKYIYTGLKISTSMHFGSYSYKYDKDTQKKVQEYFDYKYPGKQKYDAIEKMIR